MALTCTHNLWVVLGPYTQCCPCEASEQKWAKNQNTILAKFQSLKSLILLHFSMNLSEAFKIDVNMDYANNILNIGLQNILNPKSRKRFSRYGHFSSFLEDKICVQSTSKWVWPLILMWMMGIKVHISQNVAKMANFGPKIGQDATFAPTLNGHNSVIFIRFWHSIIPYQIYQLEETNWMV